MSVGQHRPGKSRRLLTSVDAIRWYIDQSIDFPEQHVQMLPSISELTLVINSDACDDSATCPLPLPEMWERSQAWASSEGNITISDDVDAGQWDEDMTTLLGIEGRGRYFMNRLTLNRDGNELFQDGTALMLSDSYAVSYPGGQSYTIDAGFFSLYGAEDRVQWSAENGTTVSFNRTLPKAYQNGDIPSISYGLHVGSVYPSVDASLVLGGYDSSRAISDPIVSDTDTFTLNTISLDSIGGYMYYGEPEPSDNQLTAPGMEVSMNPGAPYMYLPRATCDKIAEYLPVKYNEDFNLYFWDKGDSAFKDITSSLHFLSFGFESSNNRTQRINVPFGLLNLTLTSPLVSEPTPYFPCSPLRNGQRATLGRAFLQAAFLAHNWETQRIFLSQAPGPDHQPPYIRAIASDDSQLTPATNPPSWASTWTSTLPLWDDSKEKDDSDSLSSGAIAGIVVAIVALLALGAGLTLWFLRRRKQRRSWTKPGDVPVELSDGRASRSAGAYHERTRYAYYKSDAQPVEIHEAEARPPAQEMDAAQQIRELPAEDGARDVWKR